jgi:hypothetical protein
MSGWIPWLVGGMCLLSGGMAVALRPSGLTSWFFFFGMLLLAVEQLVVHEVVVAAEIEEVGKRLWSAMLVESLLVPVWLCFSLSYGRGNHREFFKRWKWVVAGSVVLPQALLWGAAGGMYRVEVEGLVLWVNFTAAGKAWVLVVLLLRWA